MTARSHQKTKPPPPPPGPRPTFLNLPEEKRRRIVELAIEEFSDHPYAQASLSRIVSRAGIAKGSVYQYFDDKLTLYRWLFTEEVARRKSEHLRSRPPPAGGDFFTTFEHLFLAGLEFWIDNPRLARLAATVLEPTADPEVRDFNAEIRRGAQLQLAEMVRAAQAAGEVRADVDPGVAAGFVGAFMGNGLIDALLARLGVDLHTFLAKPSLAARLPEDDRRALARQAIALLRGGLAPPADKPASSNAAPRRKGALS